jgi:hypothetical protein
LIQPGTVVNVVNSYAATSEYTPARLLRSVDFPTDGKKKKKNINSLILFSIVMLQNNNNNNNNNSNNVLFSTDMQIAL